MTETIPLFPLGSVVLPTTPVELHIFEPRYRTLVEDLLHGVIPGKRFGVVAIRQGWEVGDGNVDSMYDVGCSAILRSTQQLPEGRYDVQAEGEARFQLLQVDTEAAPYLMAHVRWLPDDQSCEVAGPAEVPESHQGLAGKDGPLERLLASAKAAHERYHTTGPHEWLDHDDSVDLEVDPELLSYVLTDNCTLTTEDRQAVLEETDPLARLKRVRNLLVRETEFLRELRAVPAPLTEFAQHTSAN